MPTLFEYIDSISLNKNYLMESVQDEKDYVPYLVNKHLSLFPDTIMYANEMNRFQDIPKRTHYDFYINSIVKRKRFSKWPKREKESEDLKMIAEYFICSYEKARTTLSILTQKQVEEIRSITDIGGRR